MNGTSQGSVHFLYNTLQLPQTGIIFDTKIRIYNPEELSSQYYK